MTRTRFQARTSETLLLLKNWKQLTGAVCGPLTLGAHAVARKEARHRKVKTSLKKREDNAQTQSQNTHPLHHFILL